MRAYLLSVLLLLVVAFSFATTLEPWYQTWEGSRTKSENVIQVALGDSRKLFARHFFVKADAYFHNGYYPTIYDTKEGFEEAHIAGEAQGAAAEEEKSLDFLGKPKDWIDSFSRHLFPSRHTHLGDGGCGHSCCQRGKNGHDEDHDHDHDHDHGEHDHAHHDHDHDGEESGSKGADEREMLPWLKLAIELDPKRVETYVVSAYWLRGSLKQVDEAERLLRDGLRQMPGQPEILFELGRIYLEDREDVTRARNVWQLALKNLPVAEAGQEDSNVFLRAQLLGNLASLEEKHGSKSEAIGHLERLRTISPNKDGITKWIEAIRSPEPPK